MQSNLQLYNKLRLVALWMYFSNPKFCNWNYFLKNRIPYFNSLESFNWSGDTDLQIQYCRLFIYWYQIRLKMFFSQRLHSVSNRTSKVQALRKTEQERNRTVKWKGISTTWLAAMEDSWKKKHKVRPGRLKNVTYKYLKFPNFGYVY